MSKPRVIKSFINICSITFKTFDYEVSMSTSKSNLWNFTAFSARNPKRYLIMCAPELAHAKTLIKLALNKVPNNHRLVVVTSTLTDIDIEFSLQSNYTLVSIQELKDYGDEMLTIREKENEPSANSFVDQVISKDDSL
jgi:hypothetical protein